MTNDSGWQVPDDAPRHYQDQVQRFMTPFAEALVATAVSPGDSVLDVACGTGIATRAAASAVGIAGNVVGSDINVPMLSLAAEITEEANDGITWQEASALDLPYDDGAFHCAISQQGIQFFPDVAAGLGEMARVTKAGGRVAVTVWSGLIDSPYFEAMHHVLKEYCGASDEDLAWSSDHAQLSRWFIQGGLRPPAIQRVSRTVSFPPLDTYVPAHMKATPWAAQFDALSDSETASAVGYMIDSLSKWSTGTAVTTPFVSLLASSDVP